MKTSLINNGLDHFDNDITDCDFFPFGDFCPFARFNGAVTKNVIIFNQHFCLSAGIDKVKKFNQFMEFDKRFGKGISHELSFTVKLIDICAEEKGKKCMKALTGFMIVITSGRVEGVEHEDELR